MIVHLSNNRSVKFTQREQEYMLMLSEGYSHGQMAEKLGLSRRTIENYAAALKLKVGVETLVQLGVVLCKSGVIR